MKKYFHRLLLDLSSLARNASDCNKTSDHQISNSSSVDSLYSNYSSRFDSHCAHTHQNILAAAIRKEFIEGSAIAPELFDAAIQIVPDIEVGAGHDVSAPINEFLGWKYTRFGHQAVANRYAALSHNEDGSPWQAKIFGGKIAKDYKAPIENGNRAYFPPVPAAFRKLISKRYGVDVPLDVPFWDWIVDHTEIPLLTTEGKKKALSALSQGYVAIALYGCTCGNSPDLERLMQPGREWLIAFDQDAKPKTRNTTSAGIATLSIRISKSKGLASVVQWHPSQGKGLDDVIVQSGAEVMHQAIKDATPFSEWKTSYLTELNYKVDFPLNLKRITDEAIAEIQKAIPKGTKLILFKAGKNFGKTYGINELTKGKSKLVLGHRNRLMEELGKVFGIENLYSLRKEGKSLDAIRKLESLALCENSFQPESDPGFRAEDWYGVDFVVIDEIEQVIWHLLDSSTLANGKRVLVAREIIKLLKYWISPESHTQLIAADADLSLSVKFLEAIAGCDIPTFLISNEHKGKHFKVLAYNRAELWLSALEGKIRDGKKALVMTSGQTVDTKYGSIALERFLRERFPHLKIIRIDSETVEDRSHAAFNCMSDLDALLIQYDIAVCSPTIETGVSIDIVGHFDCEFDYQGGNLPESNARQQMNRLREPVDRHLFAQETGHGWVSGTSGSTSPREILKNLDQTSKVKTDLLDMSLIDGELDQTFLAEGLQTWAMMAARINLSMHKYRDCILKNLQKEGCEIQLLVGECDHQKVEEVKANHSEIFEERVEVIQKASQITRTKFDEIDGNAKENADQQRQAERFAIGNKYATHDCLDKQTIGRDFKGWYSPLRLHYFLAIGRSNLPATDAARVQATAKDGQIFKVDLQKVTLGDKIKALDMIGFTAILERLESDEAIGEADPSLCTLAENAKKYSKVLKLTLGCDIKAENEPHTILGKLLELVGLRKERTTKRSGDPLFSVNRSPIPKKVDHPKKSLTHGYRLAKLSDLIAKAEKVLQAKAAKKAKALGEPVESSPEISFVDRCKFWSLDDGRAAVFERWNAQHLEAANKKAEKNKAENYREADKTEKEYQPDQEVATVETPFTSDSRTIKGEILYQYVPEAETLPTPKIEPFKPSIDQSVVCDGFTYTVKSIGTATATIVRNKFERIVEFHQLERIPELALAG
jgi:hypothetical protein